MFGRIGPAAVLSLLGQCIRDGGGVRQFLLWLRDLSAYEQRQNSSRYQRWLLEFSDRRDGKSDVPQLPGILEVQPSSALSDHDGKSVWSVNQLADQVSSSAEFLMFGHKNAVASRQAVARLLEIAEETSADLVYADEDQLTDRERSAPKFKPGLSIDLLREEDYVGPVFLIRRVAVARVLAELSEDQTEISSYEIVLRLHELDARIERAGEVLVSWTTPRNPQLSEQERQSLRDHLMRCYGDELGSALAVPPARLRPASNRNVKVSIVIPTRDRIDLLAKCLDSIYRIDDGPPFEVIIVNNGSVEAMSNQWLRDAPGKFEHLAVIDADIPFNWSKLNNIGAEAANGDVLLFLNNDVEVISEDWLDRMLAHALRPDVGVVGPLLLYPNGTIQHAGVVVGIGGFADHVYSGCPAVADDGHIYVDPLLARNVLACTGACMMLSKEKYSGVEGFDERLAICGDIDICARLHQRGLVNRYDPHVVLIHHESASRSRSPLPAEEMEQTRVTLQSYLAEGDPYYNPNLAVDSRYPTFSAA